MALGCILNDLVIDVGAEIEMRCSKLHNNLIQYFVARLEGLRKVSLSPLIEKPVENGVTALKSSLGETGEAGGTNGNVSSVHCEIFSHLMGDIFISMTCLFSKLALAQWKQNLSLPLQQ